VIHNSKLGGAKMNEFWFGCLVTIVCAGIAFFLSSYQLYKETKKIKKIITFTIRGMEEAGFAKYRRDAKGEIIGMIFSESITEHIRLSAETKADIPKT
jgi:hypothetical protein